MSYAFDTLSRAWGKLRDELPEPTRHGMLAHRFDTLLEELHEANHRLKDAVNNDARVTHHARQLDTALQMQPRRD